MKTIWKFTLSDDDLQEVQMPYGAEILSVGMQRDKFCLWAIVDPERPKESRRIMLRGTGHNMPDFTIPPKFLGTVFQGIYVWHLFEVEESIA